METQIIKSFSPISKNIRIRNESKSNSKQKLKLAVKTHPQPSKTNISHETSNISFSENPSTVLNFQKAKMNQKQRRTSIFFSNKQRKSLVISNKQNVNSKSINVHNFKIQKNSNFQETAGITKKLTLIEMLQQRQLKEVQQDELPTPRGTDKKYEDKQINYYMKQNDIFNSKNFSSEQFEKDFLNYKKQCQKLLSERNFSSFQISNQFSLTLNNNCRKVDCETQTTYFSNQDKYFNQYAKYRQLKQKAFSGFDDQQQKINKILSNKDNFEQNYEQFIGSLMEGPGDDRQKRIRGLSENLTKQKFHVSEAFERINQLANKFEKNVQTNFLEIKNKKDLLITSISHLLESSLFLSKRRDTENDNHKLTRILQRINNQLKCLQYFVSKTGNYGVSTFKHYNRQISILQKDFKSFTQSSFENRVLLYNCVKQIQKLPTLMVMLFGFDDKPQICQRFKGEQKMKCTFDEYMSAKCQDCFHMKKKIKLLQFHNQRIKPVIKSIQWLLEDKSKPACCLSII